MSESMLDKYVHRVVANDVADSSDALDDLGCVGILRGVRERAVSLELRKASGNVIALPYAWIERFEFDPSEGIAIRTGGQVVRLIGRNLSAELRPNARLISLLAAHRVAWIQEAGKAALMLAAEAAPVVESIVL